MKILAAQKYEIIEPISFEIDREYMINLLPKLEWKQYTHKNGKVISNYQYAHYHNDQLEGFIDIMPMLKNCKWRTSFVKLTGSELEWHTDKNNKCAIIWGLKGWEDSCTYFNPGRKDGGRADHYKKWVYRDAIIDTTKEHKVVLHKGEKITYKISIIDKDFNWLCTEWAKAYKGFKFNK